MLLIDERRARATKPSTSHAVTQCFVFNLILLVAKLKPFDMKSSIFEGNQCECRHRTIRRAQTFSKPCIDQKGFALTCLAFIRNFYVLQLNIPQMLYATNISKIYPSLHKFHIICLHGKFTYARTHLASMLMLELESHLQRFKRFGFFSFLSAKATKRFFRMVHANEIYVTCVVFRSRLPFDI